jgi:hypothetical protein
MLGRAFNCVQLSAIRFGVVSQNLFMKLKKCEVMVNMILREVEGFGHSIHFVCLLV